MSIRALKIITPVILILLAIISGLFAFVFTTEPGLRLAFSQFSQWAPGDIKADNVYGRLIDHIEIEGLHYQHMSLSLEIKSLTLDWEHLALLRRTLHLNNLVVDGIHISRTTSTIRSTDKQPRIDNNNDSTLPLKIILDQLLMNNISIKTDEKTPTIIKQIKSDAITVDQDLNIEGLFVKTTNFQASVTGQAGLAKTLPVNFTITWSLDIPGRPSLKGYGELSGDIQRLEISQSITQPEPASFSGIMTTTANDITTLNNYTFSLETTLHGNNNIPQSNWALTGRGDLNGVSVDKLHGKLLDGEISGTGELSWQPVIVWDARFTGQKINPGKLWPEWPGDINFSGHTTSLLKNKKLISHIALDTLGGNLRGYPLSGKAKIDLAPGNIFINTLSIKTGTNLFSLSGNIGRTWDITWNLSAPDLQALSPYINGNVVARGTIQGNEATPAVSLSLNGNNIEYKTARIADMDIMANIATNISDTSSLIMNMKNINLAGKGIDNIALDVKGTSKLHHLSSTLSSKSLNALLTIDGSLLNNQWNASLQSSQIKSSKHGKWTLRSPSTMYASMSEFNIDDTCWENGDAILCTQTHWEQRAGWNLNTTARQLALELLNPYLTEELNLSGTFDADIEMGMSVTSGLLTGNVAIKTGKGKISQTLLSGSIIDLDFDQFKLMSSLDNQRLSGNLSFKLPDKDYIDGRLDLPRTAINALHTWEEISDFPVEGTLSSRWHNLELIPYFVTGIENTDGILNSDLSISGTLRNPQIGGKMTIKDGSLEIPRAGLHIKDIVISITGDNQGKFNLNSELHSGTGKVAITGTIGLNDDRSLTTNLDIKGTSFETVRIPEIELYTSPDLNILVEKNMINITGNVHIPKASIEPRDLQLTIRPSADVKIKTPDTRIIEKQKWETHSLVRLTLAEDIVFNGFGLTGNITGDVVVLDTSRDITTALGELQINRGEYRAYGQKLKIDKGRLLFVGGPIDNPGLDIRATRKAGNVTAGVDIQGTLQAPRTSVFSNPAMDESDALSYLVLGRPINQASREEGQLLHGAATSLGFAGGEFLAKELGQAFDIDEVSIESDSTVEETSLFLGRQISSRLYVRYGIGLIEAVNTFQMRYQLGSKWNLQAETGLQQGADLLYTIER